MKKGKFTVGLVCASAIGSTLKIEAAIVKIRSKAIIEAIVLLLIFCIMFFLLFYLVDNINGYPHHFK
jgi:hypothetical protein